MSIWLGFGLICLIWLLGVEPGIDLARVWLDLAIRCRARVWLDLAWVWHGFGLIDYYIGLGHIGLAIWARLHRPIGLGYTPV